MFQHTSFTFDYLPTEDKNSEGDLPNISQSNGFSRLFELLILLYVVFSTGKSLMISFIIQPIVILPVIIVLVSLLVWSSH